MSEHHFESHRPVSLFVEIGKGSVTIVATDTTESSVEVTGRDAESVRVEQSGDQISVVAPKQRIDCPAQGTVRFRAHQEQDT